MPPRTSRPRVRSSVSRAEAPTVSHDVRHSLASHGSLLTILWVVVLFFSIGIWLTIFVHAMRIRQTERAIVALSQRIDQLNQQIIGTQQIPVVQSEQSASSTGNSLPAAKPVSDLLERGSLSPDGTKYAGYDSTTKGKIGIGVEMMDTKKVKHIVIFNPNSESTGFGTQNASAMSVRWKDANTIEYDILVKKGGNWVKEVQTVDIYF